MIAKYTIEIRFPLGIHFYSPPALFFCKKILAFIYELSCFQKQETCRNCSQKEFCRYYELTGQNFQGYPAFLMQADPFAPTMIAPDETLRLTFFLVGKMQQQDQFLRLYFDQLNMVAGSPVLCSELKREELSMETASFSSLTVQTAAEPGSLSEGLCRMLLYWNEAYACEFTLPQAVSYEKQVIQVEELPVQTRTRRIIRKGIAGEFGFFQPLQLPVCLLETGIGRWNWCGGGHIAA